MPAGKRQEKGMEILLNLLKLKSYKQLMNDFFFNLRLSIQDNQ